MTEDKYEVHACVPEAAIRVCRTTDPQLSLKITLSSLAMREEHGSREEGIDPTPPPFILFQRIFIQFYLTFIWEKKGVGTVRGRGVGGVTQTRRSYGWHLSFIAGVIWGKFERMIRGRKLRRKEGWNGSGLSVAEIVAGCEDIKRDIDLIFIILHLSRLSRDIIPSEKK